MTVKVLTYGATVQELWVTDRHAWSANVVLGFATLDDYVGLNSGGPYFGCVIGRYGSRIARGTFELDGNAYRLEINDPPNSLHGGSEGFDAKVWEATTLPPTSDRVGLTLHHTSPDGEGGYPGTLSVDVTYTLTNEDALRIDYRATTDAATVVNLTNHTYWNLSGEGTGTIYDHVLWVDASRYALLDATRVPTGELALVAGTPFDFTKPTRIGARLRTDHEQIRRGRGYDQYLVLDRDPASREPARAATLTDPASGRRLDVATTAPGIQCYSGNLLDGTLPGTSGQLYRQGDGIALETQRYPDAPNHESFPSAVLRPGELFESTTVFTLSNGA